MENIKIRQDIQNWKHNSGDKIWGKFLDLFEIAPVSDKEFTHIIKNSSENFERHRESHYDPVRKCLNSIYDKNKFTEQDLTKIDDNFLNSKKVNFKVFLSRIEKYPISEKTFNSLIESSNTTGDYDKFKQNIIEQSKTILKIANELHGQDKYIQSISYISFEKISHALEKEIAKSIKDSPVLRKNRLDKAPKIPEQIQITSIGFKRNPDVVAEVLLRANGICEKCNKNAPFIRKKDNTPYLEVHHKIMLSDGGEDSVKNTIAICPNCHRELHFGV
jgi:predicted HNH restriction endonuclease